MTFGILSFGAALGEPTAVVDAVSEYDEDVERILAYKYRNVLRSPDGVGLTDLAVDAGRKAIEAAGIVPAELDLVVLAITDIAEYLYWDAAASVAHRLGADGAEAVLLSQACTAGVVSLDALAGKFATHPDYRTALVVAVNRTSETYWNRMSTQPMVFSDGAAAAVVRRGHPRLRWLVTEVLTDGRYADLYRLDAGGATLPFGSGEFDEEALRARDAWSVMEFFDYDAERFEAFAAELDDRTCQVVDAACKRVDIERAQLARLIMLSDNSEAMTKLAGRLGLPMERTNLELALEYGHLGAADQLYCLGQYSAENSLVAGDKVALVSRGRGMHWACTILEA
jgi:3-oxoacyl-[acyl-carrier-protein] synthase-3